MLPQSLSAASPIPAVVKMNGVNVEAVLRVEDDEENGGKRKNKSRQKEVEDDLGLSMLIDSQNNQYVLTKPRDSTIPRADHHFIKVSSSLKFCDVRLGIWLCRKSKILLLHLTL